MASPGIPTHCRVIVTATGWRIRPNAMFAPILRRIAPAVRFYLRSCTDTDGDLTPTCGITTRRRRCARQRRQLSDPSVIWLQRRAARSTSTSAVTRLTRPCSSTSRIRPTDVDHLFLTNNVYDWPGFDTQATFNAFLTDTLAAYQSELLDPSVSNTDNGDCIVTDALELTLPWNASNRQPACPFRLRIPVPSPLAHRLRRLSILTRWTRRAFS